MFAQLICIAAHTPVDRIPGRRSQPILHGPARCRMGSRRRRSSDGSRPSAWRWCSPRSRRIHALRCWSRALTVASWTSGWKSRAGSVRLAIAWCWRLVLGSHAQCCSSIWQQKEPGQRDCPDKNSVLGAAMIFDVLKQQHGTMSASAAAMMHHGSQQPGSPHRRQVKPFNNAHSTKSWSKQLPSAPPATSTLKTMGLQS